MCQPDTPPQPGALDDVVLPGLAVINVSPGVRSITVSPGASASATGGGFATTAGFTNHGSYQYIGGNGGYGGPMLNTGTWIEESDFARTFTNAVLTNTGSLVLRGINASPASGTTNEIVNSGSIVKTTSGFTSLGIPLTNAAGGSLAVQEGELRFPAMTYAGQGGTMAVSAGATVRFQSSSLRGAVPISNAGTVLSENGLATAAATTLAVTGNPFMLTTSLDASAGTFTNAGLLEYAGGNVGYAGSLVNAPGAAWVENSEYARVFTNATLTNHGTLEIRGMNVSAGPGAAAIVNDATLLKTTGGLWTVAIPVTNASPGTLALQGGTTGFYAGSRLIGAGGTMGISPGATLRFQGGTIEGTITASNAGLVEFYALDTSAPATLNVTGNGAIVRGDVHATAGTLTNTGTVRVQTGNAGYAGTIVNAPGALWSEESDYSRAFAGCTFTNNGTMELRGIVLGSSGTLPNSFTNNALLRRIPAANVAFYIPVNNNGLFLLEGATTQMFADIVQTGSGTVRALSGAAVGGSPLTIHGGRVEGYASFAQSVGSDGTTFAPGLPDQPPGPMTIGGSYTQGPDSTLAISIRQRPSPGGGGQNRLECAQSMALAGTLRVDVPNSFVPTIGDVYEVARCAPSQRTGIFSTLDVHAAPLITFNVAYTPSSAYLTVTGTRCAVDLDDGSGSGTPDGGVDINDLVFFLVAFESGDLSADLDDDGDPAAGTPDGGVDINDLVFFLSRFEAGC